MEVPSTIQQPDDRPGNLYPKSTDFDTPYGSNYEIKLAMLLFLKASNKRCRFQIASNVEPSTIKINPLDDIVFSYERHGKWRSIFIQLKHKDNGQWSKSENFTKPNGRLGIKKFYDAYLKIKDPENKISERIFKGSLEDAKFVVYTNGTIINDAAKFFEEVNVSDEDELLSTKFRSERVLRLERSDSNLEKLKIKKADKKFLEQFQTYSGEPDVHEIDGLIEVEINDEHTVAKIFDGFNIKRIVGILFKNFEKWFLEIRDDKTGLILDQNNDIFERAVRMHKCEFHNSINGQQLALTNVKFKVLPNEVMNVLNRETKSYQILFVSFASKTVRATTTLIFQCLRKLKINFMSVNSAALFLSHDEYVPVWRVKQNVLVLICRDEETVPDLRVAIADLVDDKRQIVCLASREGTFFERAKEHISNLTTSMEFTEYDYNFAFDQLDENSISKVAQKLVNFQGNNTKMADLFGKLDDLKNPGLVNFIVDLESKAIVGKPISVRSDFVIERSLLRESHVNLKIFHPAASFSEQCFVTGIGAENLRRLLMSTVGGFLGSHSVNEDTFHFDSYDPESDVEELSDERGEPVHWLHFDCEKMYWKMSCGGTEGILRYTEEEPEVSRLTTELLDRLDRVVVLVADPGMGKSTLVNAIAHQYKENHPGYWVLEITLSNKLFTDYQSKCQNFSPLGFLIFTACNKKPTRFERSTFNHFLCETGDMIILLDAADEIDDDNFKNFQELLRFLIKDTKVKKIWVTSRPRCKYILETSLSTIAFSLQKLSETDKKDLLADRLYKPKKSYAEILDVDQRNNIENLLKFFHESLGDKTHTLTDVPLHVNMMADVYNDMNKTFEDSWKPNLLNMYEQFVEQKYVIALKVKLEMHNYKYILNDQRATYNNKHFCMALILLLGDTTLKNVFSSDQLKEIRTINMKTIEEIENGFVNVGIVTKISNGNPEFLHWSFVEYFVGIYFAEKYGDIADFAEIQLYGKKFTVARKIFDRKLCKELPLHTAVLDRNKSAFDALLADRNVNINGTDKGGRTALHLASAVGGFDSVNLGMAEALLARSGGTDCVDKVLKWTPLRYADETETYDVIELLIGDESCNTSDLVRTTKAKDDLSKLEILVQRGCRGIVKHLLDCELDVDTTFANGSTLLHKAIEYDHPQMCETLIGQRANIEYTDNSENTPLHLACLYNRTSIVAMLLRESRNEFVDKVNKEGHTPLHIAAEIGNIEIVKKLLENGGNVLGDRQKRTALHVAAFNGHAAVVKCLLERHWEVNARDNMGDSPLLSASFEGHVDVVRALVDGGADIRAGCNEGRTPLHLASLNGHIKVLEFLLDQLSAADSEKLGAYANVKTATCDTPLHYAAHSGCTRCIQRLLSAGADVRATQAVKWTPLHFAAQRGHCEAVKILLDRLKLFGEGYRTTDAIHVAAMFGNTDVVALLIDEGVDAKLSSRGCTTLTLAADCGHVDAVDLLLAYSRGDRDFLNCPDGDGVTALHLVAAKGYAEITERLLKERADPSLVDKDGKTALQIAEERGHNKVVDIINDYIANNSNKS